MITEANWLGLRAMRSQPPCPHTAVISILDQLEEHQRPANLHEYARSLTLHFVDTFERDGDIWPDEMTEEQHNAVCTIEEDRAPVLSDALAIVGFVREFQAGPEPRKLLVHCYGGVSRSAAVAYWLHNDLGIPLPRLAWDPDGLKGRNPRVLRLLRKAWAEPLSQSS